MSQDKDIKAKTVYDVRSLFLETQENTAGSPAETFLKKVRPLNLTTNQTFG
jgi:hypothetical protein